MLGEKEKQGLMMGLNGWDSEPRVEKFCTEEGQKMGQLGGTTGECSELCKRQRDHAAIFSSATGAFVIRGEAVACMSALTRVEESGFLRRSIFVGIW